MWNISFRANCFSDVINWRASFLRLGQLDFVRLPRPNDVSSSQFWMAYWTCTTSGLYVQFYWSFELYRLVVRHRCSWSWSKVSHTSFRAISRHPSVNSFIMIKLSIIYRDSLFTWVLSLDCVVISISFYDSVFW